MKHILLTLVITLAITLLAGCGRHCIAVDGSYKGIDGQVEYCFDYGASKVSGVPSFKNGEGTTYFGFDKEFLEKIENKIKDMVNIKSNNEKKEKNDLHIVRRIKELVECKDQ